MGARCSPQLASDEAPSTRCACAPRSTSWSTPDTIVIGDGGDFVGSAANVLRPRGFGHWLDAGPLGTLGVGPGYAMAAKLASPKSDVIIMYGDGAFGLNGMEFEACIRQKINIVGVIGNDAAWTQILRGQEQLYGPDRTPALQARRTPATTRWSRRSAATASRSRRRTRSARRSSARSAPASRRVVNVKIGAQRLPQGRHLGLGVG